MAPNARLSAHLDVRQKCQPSQETCEKAERVAGFGGNFSFPFQRPLCRFGPRKTAEILGFSRATRFADLSLVSPSNLRRGLN